MKKYRYLILGAGPSGLSFAHALLEKGETSFLVVEKEIVAGGLCRSTIGDGAPLDIGGGHFLDLKRRSILDLLFRFLPKNEWHEYQRGSRIRIEDQYIDYPFESNLWQLPIDEQVEYLKSISHAGCVRGAEIPQTFSGWIHWKLGDRIVLGEAVESLDLERLIVNGKYQGEQIISSIPWSVWQQLANIESTELNDAIVSLKHISVDVDYMGEEPHESAHWIYEPDEALSYHRILCRSNFYEGAKGSWTETNSKRAGKAKGYRYRNDYAYPLNTKGKPAGVAKILEWFAERRVVGMGRWGKWEHMNSDVAVSEGIMLADKLLAAR